jgi:hypothetical protein
MFLNELKSREEVLRFCIVFLRRDGEMLEENFLKFKKLLASFATDIVNRCELHIGCRHT